MPMLQILQVCKVGTCPADFGFCIPRLYHNLYEDYLNFWIISIKVHCSESRNSLHLGHSGIEDKFTNAQCHLIY